MKNSNIKPILLVGLGITTVMTGISAIHSHRKIRKLRKKLSEADEFIAELIDHCDCDFCGCLDELEDE